MKRLIITLLILTPLSSFSQNRIMNYIGKLEQPARNSVHSTVTLDRASNDILSTIPSKGTVSGYRICIFIGNGQNARSDAANAQALLKSKFPQMACYPSYKDPNFVVSAGDFLNPTEANLMFSLVRGVFTRALIVPEEIPIQTFTNQLIIQTDASKLGSELD